jgi:hypothetical protein
LTVTRRALIAALIPGLVVFGVFWLWLKMAVVTAIAAGLLWAFGSYLVTRYLYDDADAELAAWQAEAPDLAGPLDDPQP